MPDAEAPQVVEGPISGAAQDSDALCPSGTKVVNGGFVSRSWQQAYSGESYDNILANAPMASGQGWFARELQGNVQARALCAPANQAPQVVEGLPSTNGQPSVANCPTGSKAIGGGSISHYFEESVLDTAYDAVTAESPTQSGEGWWGRQLKGRGWLAPCA
ncbi:hypothetical protein NKH77_17320 [Streptomyces sp. M19]